MRIVMFPWLAMGHLIPFLRLSKLLAKKGNQIYFISTPSNLTRLPKIPSTLSSNITLVSFPLPKVPNLSPHAESSMDVSYNHQQLLKKAFDLLEHPLTSFLETTKPDWVLYDYPSVWLPSVAAKLGIAKAYFSLFTAACLSFVGPPNLLTKGEDYRSSAEDFTVSPKWIPFSSKIVYRLHEITKYVEKTSEDSLGPPDTVRFGFTVGGSDVIAIRSSPEVEPEWFELLRKLHGKPVLSVGFLPPVMDADEEEENSDDETWRGIKEWLDGQKVNSVVYVALGTETALTKQEVGELAIGLEESDLPFFWVLKNPPGSAQRGSELLPQGFEERVRGRGYVYMGWAPQTKILSHDSIGGFLTHCGWNSVIEGLSLGRVLVLMPFMNDQGLNARLLHEKKLGLEVPRDDRDGSFSSEVVAESLRLAMVDDKGEPLRSLAKEMGAVIGDRDWNNIHLHRFVLHLEKNRISSSVS